MDRVEQTRPAAERRLEHVSADGAHDANHAAELGLGHVGDRPQPRLACDGGACDRRHGSGDGRDDERC
jgi:hypothetical protein